MGDVVCLTERRADRAAAQLDRAAREAPDHPALRWVAGDTYWLAHRRNTTRGGADCGYAGQLTLAPPGVPLCVDCYPP